MEEKGSEPHSKIPLVSAGMVGSLGLGRSGSTVHSLELTQNAGIPV